MTISLPFSTSKMVGKVMFWLPLSWVAKDTLVGGRTLHSMKNKIIYIQGRIESLLTHD